MQRADEARLLVFLTTTFWQNSDALACIFAATTLALHGENVDRAFWSRGPGGVGQSLMSHLLATALGNLHRWVDMQVYFSDDEMRKQSELLVGGLVVTGQESPEVERRMREDVFKKHISADPVSCRLPYAVVTRMVSLTGWNRYEMNELMRFTGTTEESFDSIFRRSLIIMHKARFLSADEFQRTFPDGGASEQGYFVKDNTLKSF